MVRLLGCNAITVSCLAAHADEATLARFPPPAWCESQEASLLTLQQIKSARWHCMLNQVAVAEGVDPETLERLVSQAYALGLGRKLEVIRLCLAVLDDSPIMLVTDLPEPVLQVFLKECGDRVRPAQVACHALRFLGAVKDVLCALGRQARRIQRMVKLLVLPAKPANPPSYIAWLGALPAEVAHRGPDRQSLIEFLDEARSGAVVEQVVIQGAKPAHVPPGLLYRKESPPLRYRPSWILLVRAVFDQLRQAIRQCVGAFDSMRRSLVGPLLTDLPGYRLWFTADAPAAVLYSNAMIGGEPPIALLRRRFGVPSMMVFYSANVSYAHPPARYAGPATRLEPEIRFIVADRITMWSDTMTEAFRSAGYSSTRLIETGPVVLARQQDFTPTSRYATGKAGEMVRIGIFDVSVQRPQRRFEMGYGQLIYNADYAATFFRDIFEAARARYGDRFVIVRKLKRALSAIHNDDLDFSRLPPATIIGRDPAESLWKVLEAVDLVLCMPFTSLAYLADQYGIPAAYYDPSGTVVRSPLGGRAALLSGRAALDSWLAAPMCSAPRRSGELIGSKVMMAALHHGWSGTGSCHEAVMQSSNLHDHQFDVVGSHNLRDGTHA